MDIAEALVRVPYPGRALLVARHDTGGLSLVYVLTGRSRASRERVLVAEGEELLVRPASTSDPDPLRHYRAVRRTSTCFVAGNGDHVDQLAAQVEDGIDPQEALCRMRPEPDALRTARLAAVIPTSVGGVLVGAARALPAPGCFDHVIVRAGEIPRGLGCGIRTYGGSRDAPSVAAEPTWVEVASPPEALVEAVWSALDPRVRIAVAGRMLAPDASWVIVGGLNG